MFDVLNVLIQRRSLKVTRGWLLGAAKNSQNDTLASLHS